MFISVIMWQFYSSYKHVPLFVKILLVDNKMCSQTNALLLIVKFCIFTNNVIYKAL